MPPWDADKAGARADLCRFLSACYYEPCAEFGEERLFDSIVNLATRLDAALAVHARRLREAFAAQDLQDLLVDYTRLFLGPLEVLAKPYGVAWLAAPEPGQDCPSPAILDLYTEGGFELDGAFTDLPDHVAVELEFLYLLVFNENRAVQSGNLNQARAARALRERLLAEHLGAWIAPFTQAMQAAAHTAFYRELAMLTDAFIRADKGWADAPSSKP